MGRQNRIILKNKFQPNRWRVDRYTISPTNFFVIFAPTIINCWVGRCLGGLLSKCQKWRYFFYKISYRCVKFTIEHNCYNFLKKSFFDFLSRSFSLSLPPGSLLPIPTLFIFWISFSYKQPIHILRFL